MRVLTGLLLVTVTAGFSKALRQKRATDDDVEAFFADGGYHEGENPEGNSRSGGLLSQLLQQRSLNMPDRIDAEAQPGLSHHSKGNLPPPPERPPAWETNPVALQGGGFLGQEQHLSNFPQARLPVPSLAGQAIATSPLGRQRSDSSFQSFHRLVGSKGNRIASAATFNAPQRYPAAPQPYPAAPQPYPAAPQPYPAAPQPYPATPQPIPAAPQHIFADPKPIPTAPQPYSAAPQPIFAAPQISSELASPAAQPQLVSRYQGNNAMQPPENIPPFCPMSVDPPTQRPECNWIETRDANGCVKFFTCQLSASQPYPATPQPIPAAPQSMPAAPQPYPAAPQPIFAAPQISSEPAPPAAQPQLVSRYQGNNAMQPPENIPPFCPMSVDPPTQRPECNWIETRDANGCVKFFTCQLSEDRKPNPEFQQHGNYEKSYGNIPAYAAPPLPAALPLHAAPPLQAESPLPAAPPLPAASLPPAVQPVWPKHDGSYPNHFASAPVPVPLSDIRGQPAYKVSQYSARQSQYQGLRLRQLHFAQNSGGLSQAFNPRSFH